jgi:hypothetical protein
VSRSSFRAFLDRVEGEIAVLLMGEEEREQLLIPRSYLPRGTREGAVLKFTVEVDEEATKAALDEVKALLDELRGQERRKDASG